MLFGDFKRGLIALASSDVHMKAHCRSFSPIRNYRNEPRTPSDVEEAHAEFKRALLAYAIADMHKLAGQQQSVMHKIDFPRPPDRTTGL